MSLGILGDGTPSTSLLARRERSDSSKKLTCIPRVGTADGGLVILKGRHNASRYGAKKEEIRPKLRPQDLPYPRRGGYEFECQAPSYFDHERDTSSSELEAINQWVRSSPKVSNSLVL